MSHPNDAPISISAPPAVWLEIGRQIGGAKRSITRLREVIRLDHDGTKEGIERWARRIESLRLDAEWRLGDARKSWGELIDHQAPELPDDARGGGA